MVAMQSAIDSGKRNDLAHAEAWARVFFPFNQMNALKSGFGRHKIASLNVM
jgi:hypothetical protein